MSGDENYDSSIMDDRMQTVYINPQSYVSPYIVCQPKLINL